MSATSCLIIIAMCALGTALIAVLTAKLNAYVNFLADGLSAWRIRRPIGSSLSGGTDRTFASRDGVPLTGTYFQSRTRHRGILMFVHDVEGTRESVTEYLDPLLNAGYDVFAFDLRSTGQSNNQTGSDCRPFWAIRADVNDVLGCVDFLSQEGGGPSRRIGAIGISCGGTAVLCAAALDKRIAAIATDGSFPFEDLLIHHIRRLTKRRRKRTRLTSLLPDEILCLLGKLAIRRIWRGRQEQSLRSRSLLRRLRQPTLLIHGEKDTLVPLAHAQSLRSLIRNSRLWIVPDAKHNRAISTMPNKYIEQITDFFGNHLRSENKRTYAGMDTWTAALHASPTLQMAIE